jgi:hypothetical protein
VIEAAARQHKLATIEAFRRSREELAPIAALSAGSV